MPQTMFDALVTALQATRIPFAVDEWATRPSTDHGVVALDGTGDSMNGDDEHEQTALTGYVDLYMHTDDSTKRGAVESAIASVCEGAWELNSRQYERQTHLTHYEWVFELESW